MFIVRFILKILMSRPGIIVLNVLGMLFCFNILKNIYPSIIHHSGHTDEGVIKAMDGIATFFVLFGVVMEERETILQKIAKVLPKPVDHYLNEVAHEDGLGLLCLGLVIELANIAIETPNEILDTRSVDFGLIIVSITMIALSIVIQFDLFKDYIKTYFKKYKHED